MLAKMLITILGIFIASATVSAASGHDSVVQIDFTHFRKGGRISKRSADGVYGSYSIAFEIGNPPQKMRTLLDTGSSDLWVNTPKSKQTFTYDPEQSSTHKFNNSEFDIQYGSGAAKGDWVRDVVRIAGANLTDQSFGTVGDAAAGEGILGVGMVENESSKNYYVNVPLSLKHQGFVKHNAYSLFLDDLHASTGRILFGGVDTEKYKGNLSTVKLVDDASFSIDMHELKVGGKSMIDDDDSKLKVLLDSGTTFTYVPEKVAKKIANVYNATYDDSTGLYFLDQKHDNQPDFEFEFSGAKITVPSKEMIVDSTEIISGKAPMAYTIGIVATSQPPYILGDTFMRSAYLVFDLERKEVSLAQSSYSDKTDIKVINGQVPGAKKAPNA